LYQKNIGEGKGEGRGKREGKGMEEGRGRMLGRSASSDKVSGVTERLYRNFEEQIEFTSCICEI
jgi:hypothetical protein